MFRKGNVGLIVNRQIVGKSVSQFGVSRDLICHGTFYLGNKGQDYLAPLYLQTDQTSIGSLHNQGSNLTPCFLSAIGKALNAKVDQLIPEDIFHYAYAIFHSPSYRRRYFECLKIDFPRLPLTRQPALFHRLVHLGQELVELHLLESPKLDKPLSTYVGTAHPEVEKVSHSGKTVWLDKDQTCGFQAVPEEIWEFHIGGYQVCEKWLKDRKGRKLSKSDIEHYQKIVVALNETIRLMAEIDKVIEAHGGWPGAFVNPETASKSTSH